MYRSLNSLLSDFEFIENNNLQIHKILKYILHEIIGKMKININWKKRELDIVTNIVNGMFAA